jgi:hypothetical protein
LRTSLEFLHTHGLLDEGSVAAVADVVARAGAVAPLPQHGDFWFQNLLLVDDDVWVIDFEEFGQIQVPLYDDLTLILATLAVRSGGGVQGLRTMISADAEAVACRELIRDRAAAEGIDPTQMDSMLFFYLARMAAQIYRRGGDDFGRPHLEALRYATELFVAGRHDFLAVARR